MSIVQARHLGAAQKIIGALHGAAPLCLPHEQHSPKPPLIRHVIAREAIESHGEPEAIELSSLVIRSA